MVEIRVLGKDQKEVEAWFRLVAKLVLEQAGNSLLSERSVTPGREGDFIGYIRIRPPLLAGEVAAPRLPRKGRLSAGKRRK